MPDIFDTRFEQRDIDLKASLVELGDDVNLLQKDPTLKSIEIAAGWDANAFNAEIPDLDLSIFLLGKDGKTRVDEDFVFYNQTQVLEGGIKHNGDSRTGAGDGDDESISVNLHAVPLDVMQIAIVVSVYKGYEKEQNLGMVRNIYVRLLNSENNEELVRFKLDDVLEDIEETGVVAAMINREGPKWHFKPEGECVLKGLSEIAQRYGIVIGQE